MRSLLRKLLHSFMFHNYSRWITYQHEGRRRYDNNTIIFTKPESDYFDFSEVRQYRICKECGFREDVFVRAGILDNGCIHDPIEKEHLDV